LTILEAAAAERGKGGRERGEVRGKGFEGLGQRKMQRRACCGIGGYTKTLLARAAAQERVQGPRAAARRGGWEGGRREEASPTKKKLQPFAQSCAWRRANEREAPVLVCAGSVDGSGRCGGDDAHLPSA
jgi:hypothetical protein